MPRGTGGGCAGGARQLRLERTYLLVYGVEDRVHLVSHVVELDGQPAPELAPGLPVRAGERGERLDRAECPVPRVRLVQQPVSFSGVVVHAVQCASDFAQLLVVEPARPVALHEAACLLETRGSLVEVDLAAGGIVVRHSQLEIFHAALQPVQRITGEGVGAGSRDAAEGSGCDADGESARSEALRPAGAGAQFPERGRPVGASAGPLFGHLRALGHTSPASIVSMAATSWARCTTLTSGSSCGFGSSSSPVTRASNCPCALGSVGASGWSAAEPWSVCSSRAWAKAFARRCAETCPITGGTSSRHDDRLPSGSGRLPTLSASTRSGEHLRAWLDHREPASHSTSRTALGLRTKDDRTAVS